MNIKYIHHHVKKAHNHLKKHGKWYLYGHALALSVMLSLVLNYQSQSSAGLDTSMCEQTFSINNIVLDYSYTSPKKDVILKGISFDNVLFPELVLVKKVKQLTPMPNKDELSTDRGDLASYTNPNKENPNETDIAEYLSNSNLNNLIDGEGLVDVELDVEFSKTLYDNTQNSDVVGEILLFERGMNSDIYVQAVDGLGGRGIGAKVFLSKKDMIYAGFSVDTVEIAENQKIGYWKVDLDSLGVKEVKYLRISSIPANGGPDFKIIGLNTQKCQPKPLKPLLASEECTSSPKNIRQWRVINPNTQDVKFKWDIYNTAQSGDQNLKGLSEYIITTKAVEGANVMRIYENGEIKNIIPSEEKKCPLVQPLTPLTLEATCSPEPTKYKVWKLKNTNKQNFEVQWKVKSTLSCDANKVLLCQVPSGNPSNEHEICVAKQAVSAHTAKGSYLGTCNKYSKQDVVFVEQEKTEIFTTPVVDETQKLEISIDGVIQGDAKSIETRCVKQSVNDYTLEVTTDKESVLPYQQLTYSIEYINKGPESMSSGVVEFFTDEQFVYTPSEEITKISENHYAFFVGSLKAKESGTQKIDGYVLPKNNSGTIALKATILASDDVNTGNNTVINTTEIKELSPLELSSLCSDDPSLIRSWRIQNPNNIDIPVDLYINEKFFTGTIVKAKDLTYVKTNTVEGVNTLSLRYNGKKQTETSSENVVCPKPISDLSVQNVDIKKINEDIFVADILFKNLGPNVSQEVNIDIEGDSASFVVANQLQPQMQKTLDQMQINEEYVLSVTGVIASGDAQIAIAIDGKTIDPNVYNNNVQTSISTASTEAQPKIEPVNQSGTSATGVNIHDAADLNPGKIKGYDIGEQVDLEEKIANEEDTENVIGLGCHYTDESYEKIRFKDVKNHWSKPYVELLRINCIVKGREVNNFVTDDYITRSEAIKVAIKLWGINNSWKVKSDRYIYLGDTPMADVSNAHWAAQYVDKAYQIGLLNSFPNNGTKNLFPEKNIKRGEAVELLVKTYLILQNTTMKTPETSIENVFADIDTNKTYTPYVAYAYEKGFLQGVVKGDAKNFLAENAISRSEFAKVVALVFKDFLPVYSILK